MHYLFKLYFEFYWRGALIWAFLWTGFFFQFLSKYPLELTWLWAPALTPLIATASFKMMLYVYFIVNKNSFFKDPKVILFLNNNDEFTLGEFSKFIQKPQVIAHYFLIHSKKVSCVHEDVCVYKVKKP